MKFTDFIAMATKPPLATESALKRRRIASNNSTENVSIFFNLKI